MQPVYRSTAVLKPARDAGTLTADAAASCPYRGRTGLIRRHTRRRCLTALDFQVMAEIVFATRHPLEGMILQLEAPMVAAASAPVAAAGGASGAPHGGNTGVVPPNLRTRYDVPTDLGTSLETASSKGQAEARSYIAKNGSGTIFMFTHDLEDAVGKPPEGAEQQQELQELHALEKTRNDAGSEWAKWLDKNGMQSMWDAYLRQYTRSHSHAQAVEAVSLLHSALAIAEGDVSSAKQRIARDRPFTADPSLTTLVPHPPNSPSFPSGHTTAAFAAATVLGHLMPKRRQEFLDAAEQVAYSRMYAGMHFRSDVVAGAFAGTAAATYAMSIAKGALT